MSTIGLDITAAGAVPTSPAALRAALVALVAASNPGYTANLPGSLIEDIVSTDTGALVLIDSAAIELLNSLTPRGANAFLLNQLGQIYGVQLGTATRTSVNVVFSGSPGYVIAQGFTVSDGTYQYIVQDGGVIQSGGDSAELFCLATIDGIWTVPAGSVTSLITSVPTGVTLSVTNPSAGTPGAGGQTEESYRAEVLLAGMAAAAGTPAFLKTQLYKVSGVQQRLVSVRQVTGGFEIIVGGGDPYDVANAIFDGVADLENLVGSTLSVTAFTRANPGVVTTDLNHGYTTGDDVVVAGSTPSDFNGTYTSITVLTEKTFRTATNTSGYPSAYVSGGVCTPNSRNQVVTLKDYPDTYTVPFVLPPQQTVTIGLLWNTTATNFVSDAALQQLGAPALADYVNAIAVGVPMNLFEMQTVFMEAVASVLPPSLLTRMVFTISINGITTAVDAGTGIIEGDPESYFLTDTTSITISRG